MDHPLDRWSDSHIARLLLVGGAYYVTAWLSLRVALVGGVVTPIWPPTGIALVAMLIFGVRVWPAVTVAALLVNVPINDSLAGAFLIATGNTLAVVIAAGLLERTGFRHEIDRLRDAFLLVVLAALGAMTVSATSGTAALWLGGTISRGGLARTWSVWWAGDATGILVFAPFLLSVRLPRWARRRDVFEAVVLIAALIAVAILVFRGGAQFAYLVFPFLIWAALRFGQMGASVSALTVVAIAVWAAVDQRGPFAHEALGRRMLTLQAYNAVAALTSFVLAAITTERARALEGVTAGLEREHRITETLQRSLLPERLPDVPGVALVSRYLPGAAGLDVGGDWYDVFLLSGGQLGLTIGDVVGRGVGAAAAMGQLRTALRAYALETRSPAAVVEQLSRLVHEFDAAQMATLVYAVLDPETGRLSFASAGHPPPLLIDASGAARYLDDGRSPPLGVSRAAVRDAVVDIEPGSTLLFFTDGLVESRRGSIGDSMEALRQAVVGHEGDLDSLCDDRVLQAPRPEAPDDDVALLAVRLLPVPVDHLQLTYSCEPVVAASVRRAVGRWLAGIGANPEETNDIVLASNEAATNVIEHAYGPAGGVLEVEAVVSGVDVCITVRDRGQWRTARGAERGRGFALMHALVDAVDVERTPTGTEVVLRRRLGQAEGHRPSVPPVLASVANAPEPVAIVRLEGDIDIASTAALHHELVAAVSNDALGLVVDLSAVQHLDSAGVRLLYQLASRLEARRQVLRVVVPDASSVRHILILSEFDAIVPLATTIAEAVADIRTLRGDGVSLGEKW